MDKIKDAVVAVKNGAFVHITYESDMTRKLSAASRKAGYKVTKQVSTVTRTGVSYEHITRVIARKTNTPKCIESKESPYKWVIPNKIKMHVARGEEYVVLAPLQSIRPKVTYFISDGVSTVVKNALSEEDWALFTPSGRTSHCPEVIMVKVSNIKEFNHIERKEV